MSILPGRQSSAGAKALPGPGLRSSAGAKAPPGAGPLEKYQGKTLPGAGPAELAGAAGPARANPGPRSSLMYIPLLLYKEKCAQQLSYGFNILKKLESCPQENQNPYGDMDFLKKVSKVTVSL